MMENEVLYDLAQLREVASGSEEFVDKMVDMFVDMTPGLIQRIEDGLGAQDWEEVRSASHKMKPSIDMMGIVSLHGLVREIEGSAKNQIDLDSLPEKVAALKQTLEQVFDQLRSRNA